jgi:hypothetical protein
MRKFLDFIKYNNAFPIVLSVVILGTGAAFAASPELRQSVFAPSAEDSASVTPKKTDAAKLLSTDIGDFDLALRIDAVTEDAASYHAAYSYTTLEISGGAWKEVRKNGKMDIPKALLGKRDLKSYLVEQIGQVIDREIAYLSEVQATIRTKSAPEKSKEYASLSGIEVDAETRKSAEKSGSSGSMTDEPDPQEEEKEEVAPGITLTKEELNDMIVKAVSDFLAIDMNMPEPLPETVPAEAVVSDTEAAPETEEPAIEEVAPETESTP